MAGFRIVSRRPGFRRAGIAHPAVKDYAPGELSDAQLDAIRAEPNLTITEYTPESEAAPADGTLPSAGGGEDRLVVVMRAAGWPSWLAPQAATLVHVAAEGALLGGVTPEIYDRAAEAGLTSLARSNRVELLATDSWRHLGSISPNTEPQQPAELAGGKAEPEAEPVEGIDGDAAQATGHEATSFPDEVSSLPVPSSETGEATGSGSAAAAPVAVTTTDPAEAAPAKSAAKASRKSR